MNDIDYKNIMPKFLRKIIDYLMAKLERDVCKMIVKL